MSNIRQWLHGVLFRPEHDALLRITADLKNVNARYTRQLNSLWRTPHVDSPWMDKFLDLEKDYDALKQQFVASQQKIIMLWDANADEPIYRVVDADRAKRLEPLVRYIRTPEDFASYLRTMGAFRVTKVPGSAVS